MLTPDERAMIESAEGYREMPRWVRDKILGAMDVQLRETQSGTFQCWVVGTGPGISHVARGYARTYVGKPHGTLLVHRYLQWVITGIFAEEIMHNCDCPPCNNPAHLRNATHQINVDDCVRKGRHQHGETHIANLDPAWRRQRQAECRKMRGLTPEEVVEIATRLVAGQNTEDELAEEYDMSQCTISKVGRGISYPDIPRPILTTPHGTKGRGRSGMTAEKARVLYVAYVRDRVSKGVLAAHYRIVPGMVQAIVRGEKWGHATRDLRRAMPPPKPKRLTAEAVAAIRAALRQVPPPRHKDLAAQYGISRSRVGQLQEGAA